MANDETRRLERRSPNGGGIVGEVELVQPRPAVGIVEGRALAMGVRGPDRHPVRVGGGVGPPHQTGSPVDEHATRAARTSHHQLPWRGVGDGPQPGGLAPLPQHDPGDERRPADDERVALLVGASDDLLRQGVDRPGGENRVADPTHGLTSRLHAR